MRYAAGLFAVFLVLGCEASIDTGLDHKACSANGECLDGYVCGSEGICVRRATGHRSQPNVGADGGDADSGVAPASCESGSLCDGLCVDTQRDPLNCGNCGAECPSSQHGRARCDQGKCGLDCEPGYMGCGDACYALDSDAQHCGACDFACISPVGGSVACKDSQCTLLCQSGFHVCGGECVRLDNNPTHCGDCDTNCGDQKCAAGHCVLSCPEGTKECGHSCVDTQREVEHCGGCGQICKAPPGSQPVCQKGECNVQCDQGRIMCSETCVDVESDLANCGACGKACPGAPEHSAMACEKGQCVKHCDVGYTDCNGTCISGGIVDTAMMAGLGMLGVCEAQTALMQRDSCQATGQTMRYCGGSCVNIQTDTKNCGACGRGCFLFQWCVLGICISPR